MQYNDCFNVFYGLLICLSTVLNSISMDSYNELCILHAFYVKPVNHI